MQKVLLSVISLGLAGVTWADEPGTLAKLFPRAATISADEGGMCRLELPPEVRD